MASFPLPYYGYAYGDSHTSTNIVSVFWVILSPTNEIVNYGGIYLGPAKNNVVEYSAVIELMTKASALGICHLIVCLDSEFSVSHLNVTYSI